jgi:hypothetical protein
MTRPGSICFIGILVALNAIFILTKLPEWWAEFNCDLPHNKWSKTERRCLGHGEPNPDYLPKLPQNTK